MARKGPTEVIYEFSFILKQSFLTPVNPQTPDKCFKYNSIYFKIMDQEDIFEGFKINLGNSTYKFDYQS